MAGNGILGGICTTHAPQLWTLPDSEDPSVIARVRTVNQEIGKKLKAMKPDVCIVIANDHADQFLLHCNASFIIHIGKNAINQFDFSDYSNISILVDENTEKFCLPILIKKVPKLKSGLTIKIQSGEKNKTIDTCNLIWQKLNQ